MDEEEVVGVVVASWGVEAEDGSTMAASSEEADGKPGGKAKVWDGVVVVFPREDRGNRRVRRVEYGIEEVGEVESHGGGRVT